MKSLNNEDEIKFLRSQILDAVAKFQSKKFNEEIFVPGQTPIPCAGKVLGSEEMVALVDSALDFWLTAGRFADEFESVFAKVFGTRFCLLVNSGSSANLLAVSALTSPQLGQRRLRPGDEVITVAAGFPTTVNPIIQNQLTPVYLDVSIPTYNIKIEDLEKALSPKTKAIILAHTLGNPFDLAAVVEFAKKNNLWLIEDCCDALGSRYAGRQVGSFGDIATCSFYPAHHITMGEGGAVMTHSPKLKKIIESFRDWGRDCWCPPGQDNTCGKRFDWDFENMPAGYDHKYIYSHIGYNLKATDMQAAIGLAQISRIPGFIDARKKNFQSLRTMLEKSSNSLILPEATSHSEPSWFGFPVAVRKNSKFNRRDLVNHLNSKKIGTRQIFGGNLIRQPAYQHQQKKIIGSLENSDFVMENAFWVGVYPGLKEPQLCYVAEEINRFVKSFE